MKTFFQQNKVFLCLYLLFLLAGGVLLVTLKKGDETLFFNALHTGISDVFFRWCTRLAEVPMLVLITLVTLRFSYGKGLLLGLNNLLVFASILFFKDFMFAGEPRPALYFQGKESLNFVQGVEVLRYDSFPSGHTATAFALFFMLSILTTKKRWSILFFILALLVALSRMYLLEHFLRDVYFGSIIGMAVTSAFYLLFAESGLYRNFKWKDKALLN